MKKNTRRSRATYPALDKNLNIRNRQNLIDYDYLHVLSPEEKDWLNRFTEEWLSANFKHEGKRIHPRKYTTKKVQKNGKIRTVDVYRKEAEHRNNARNRCALTNQIIVNDENKANSAIDSAVSLDVSEIENSLIEKIDLEET